MGHDRLFEGVWPEYSRHGNHAPRYFGALYPRYSRFQTLFVDRRSERVVGRARTIPFRWDGTLEGLPPGIDALGLRAVEDDRPPNALSALAAEVEARSQGRGLRPEPRSLHIVAPVAEWEGWTATAFPEDGEYVFPGGLAPLVAARGVGDYWEPNVWMLHQV